MVSVILVVSLAGFFYLFIAISAVLLIVGIEKVRSLEFTL